MEYGGGGGGGSNWTQSWVQFANPKNNKKVKIEFLDPVEFNPVLYWVGM